MTSAVRPMAASSLVLGRYFSVLMMTRYVESRVVQGFGKEMPIMVGTWPTRMLIADPVMNADRATRGIMSTIQPSRMAPIKRTMAPQRMASAEAMKCDGRSGNSLPRSATTLPVT